MTFQPILHYYDLYYDLPGGNRGVTDDGLIKTTGEVRIYYHEHVGEQLNYMGKLGTIPLGDFQTKSFDKSTVISGGYQSEDVFNSSENRNRLIETTQSYIREHLDEFKTKAFNFIPESSNAIKFDIMPPTNIPIGASHD